MRPMEGIANGLYGNGQSCIWCYTCSPELGFGARAGVGKIFCFWTGW